MNVDPPSIFCSIKSTYLPLLICSCKLLNIFSLFKSTNPGYVLNAPIAPLPLINTVGIPNCIGLNDNVEGAEITIAESAIS